MVHFHIKISQNQSTTSQLLLNITPNQLQIKQWQERSLKSAKTHGGEQNFNASS